MITQQPTQQSYCKLTRLPNNICNHSINSHKKTHQKYFYLLILITQIINPRKVMVIIKRCINSGNIYSLFLTSLSGHLGKHRLQVHKQGDGHCSNHFSQNKPGNITQLIPPEPHHSSTPKTPTSLRTGTQRCIIQNKRVSRF